MAKNTAKNVFISVSLPRDSPVYSWLLNKAKLAGVSLNKTTALELARVYERELAGIEEVPARISYRQQEKPASNEAGNAAAAADAWNAEIEK